MLFRYKMATGKDGVGKAYEDVFAVIDTNQADAMQSISHHCAKNHFEFVARSDHKYAFPRGNQNVKELYRIYIRLNDLTPSRVKELYEYIEETSKVSNQSLPGRTITHEDSGELQGDGSIDGENDDIPY